MLQRAQNPVEQSPGDRSLCTQQGPASIPLPPHLSFSSCFAAPATQGAAACQLQLAVGDSLRNALKHPAHLPQPYVEDANPSRVALRLTLCSSRRCGALAAGWDGEKRAAISSAWRAAPQADTQAAKRGKGWETGRRPHPSVQAWDQSPAEVGGVLSLISV